MKKQCIDEKNISKLGNLQNVSKEKTYSNIPNRKSLLFNVFLILFLRLESKNNIGKQTIENDC